MRNIEGKKTKKREIKIKRKICSFKGDRKEREREM